MPVFLLKSILSVFLSLSALFAVFTMFEVFGRAEKKYDIEKLKKLHRANGKVYLILFAVISYLCLRYLFQTKAELSPRASLHSAFSLLVIALLLVKVSYVRIYKQFYGQAKTIGVTVAILTVMMIGSSAGYYLLVTKLGTEPFFKRSIEPVEKVEKEMKISLRTDPESIGRGKELYDSKCYNCHDPESEKPIVGPGHKGILKNPLLPASGKPATVENVAIQIRRPFAKMPSFDYLSDNEVEDIIAYLNTL